MKSKFFVIIGFLMFAMSSNAENIFIPGTIWKIWVDPQAGPEIPPFFSYRWIGDEVDINGQTGYQLMAGFEPYSDGEMLTLVRPEGEKVWLLNNSVSEEWKLAYDFGLSIGEECEVGIIKSSWNSLDGSDMIRLRCVDIFPGKDFSNSISDDLVINFDGFEIMKMEILFDEPSYPTTYIYWIKGLGSATTPELNVIEGPMGGAACGIVDVSNNGTLIFPKSQTTVATLQITDLDIHINDNIIAIMNLDAKSSTTIYTLSGQKIHEFASGNTNLQFELPSNGIYVCKNGSRSTKIINN